MIICIELEGTDYNFALFDTVPDKFIELNDHQSWNDEAEFIKDFENDKSGVSKPKYTYLVAAIPDKFR